MELKAWAYKVDNDFVKLRKVLEFIQNECKVQWSGSARNDSVYGIGYKEFPKIKGFIKERGNSFCTQYSEQIKEIGIPILTFEEFENLILKKEQLQTFNIWN